MKPILFVLASIFLIAHAQAGTCKLNGKEIDFSEEDQKPGLDGEVTCLYKAGKPDEEKDVYFYKNGLEVEWRRDTPQAKLVEQYGFENGRKVRNGIRTDFYPGTSQVQERQRYARGRHRGLQERFYENGNVKDQSFWVDQHDTLDSDMQVASVSFDKDGKPTQFSCSKVEEQNPVPKLCGFGADPKAIAKEGHKNGLRKKGFEKGVLVWEEIPYDSSAYYSIADRGVTPEEGISFRRKDYLPDGKTKVTEIYTNKKLRRQFTLNKAGRFEGEDTEYFSDGQLARKTEWEIVDGETIPKSNQCFYQNGKEKLMLKRDQKTVSISSFNDDGKKYLDEVLSLPAERPYSYASEFFACGESHYFATPNGTYILWEKNGDKKESGEYTEGRVSSKTLYKNGKVAETEAYFPDGSRKP
jgi:antitoxin component YwqK of YwqJK toxin-antitoxin module